MHDWLPLDDVLEWVKVEADTPKANVVERCRLAAADWIETDARPDLDYAAVPGAGEDPATFPGVSPKIVEAGVLCTARLFDRVGTASGVAFSELGGAGLILRYDPDVDRLLGIGPHAKPVVG